MTGTDILAAIDEIVAEHERCPCGRDLPADCPSFYWCSETCQVLWTQHQHDPTAPHPAAVRDANEARAARAGMGPAPRAPERPADGPPARPHGEERMRLWGSWQPVADAVTTGDLAYRRWCPTCQTRTAPDPRPAVCVTEDFAARFRGSGPDQPFRPTEMELAQACSQCATVWDGQPLVATAEVRTEPFHALRLALSDGARTAYELIDPGILERAVSVSSIVTRAWEHLECELLGAPTHQTSRPAPRRSAWDWMSRWNR